MARKNARNGGEAYLFDTRTKAVMARSVVNDGIKEKLKQVQEVITGYTKDDIYIALEYYELDVERTIQSFVENGAKEALDQWKFSGNRPSSKKKKKSKSQSSGAGKDVTETSKSASATAAAATAATSAPTLPQDKAVTSGNELSSISQIPQEKDGKSSVVPPSSVPTQHPVPPPTQEQQQHAAPPQQSRHKDKKKNTNTSSLLNVDTTMPPPAAQRPKQLEGGSRQRTISEQSASSVTARGKGPHAGLEKSLKDLNRQISSLTRLKSVHNEQCEHSNKDISHMFQRLQNLLTDREVTLMFELQKVKEQTADILVQRQKTAAELKRRSDRAPSMNDHELAELRADIKHFVSERKIDEDLSSARRFTSEEEVLADAIRNFGKVVPPHTNYSQRRSSATSSLSSDLLSPMTPVTPATTPSVFPPAVHHPPAAATIPSLSGAKVLAQSDSLTQYETLYKEKLSDGRPKPTSSGLARNQNNLNRPQQGGKGKSPPQQNRQQQRPQQQQKQQQKVPKDVVQETDVDKKTELSSEDADEELRKTRSARRRQRQREKQREIKRTQQMSGDSSKTMSPSDDSGISHGNSPDEKMPVSKPQQNRRTPSPRKSFHKEQGRQSSPTKRTISPVKKSSHPSKQLDEDNNNSQPAVNGESNIQRKKMPADKNVEGSGDQLNEQQNVVQNGNHNGDVSGKGDALPQRAPRNRGHEKKKAVINGKDEHDVNGVVNGVDAMKI